jgi:hypothetical protein
MLLRAIQQDKAGSARRLSEDSTISTARIKKRSNRRFNDAEFTSCRAIGI